MPPFVFFRNSELKKLKKREDFDQNSMALQNKTSSLDEETLDSSSSSSEEEDTEEEEEQSPEMKAEMKRLRNLRAMLAMAVCYSANVGGTGTLVGTPPNVILIEYLEPFEGHPLTFSSWIGFALPSVIICLIFVWIWLQIYFLGFPCKKIFPYSLHFLSFAS